MINDLKLRFDQLIWDPDRAEHIRKHRVSIDEVAEVFGTKYLVVQGKFGRWLIIGPTKRSRMLTVIVGERVRAGTYGFISARSASRTERHLYKELDQQAGG